MGSEEKYVQILWDLALYFINFALLCRWSHYIIISGSRSKLEKTMKNLVFLTFYCDPKIVLEWLQHDSNPREILAQKNHNQLFFHEKNNIFVRHPQNGHFGDFETEPETPFGNRNFFFLQYI